MADSVGKNRGGSESRSEFQESHPGLSMRDPGVLRAKRDRHYPKNRQDYPGAASKIRDTVGNGLIQDMVGNARQSVPKRLCRSPERHGGIPYPMEDHSIFAGSQTSVWEPAKSSVRPQDPAWGRRTACFTVFD